MLQLQGRIHVYGGITHRGQLSVCSPSTDAALLHCRVFRTVCGRCGGWACGPIEKRTCWCCGPVRVRPHRLFLLAVITKYGMRRCLHLHSLACQGRCCVDSASQLRTSPVPALPTSFAACHQTLPAGCPLLSLQPRRTQQQRRQHLTACPLMGKRRRGRSTRRCCECTRQLVTCRCDRQCWQIACLEMEKDLSPMATF